MAAVPLYAMGSSSSPEVYEESAEPEGSNDGENNDADNRDGEFECMSIDGEFKRFPNDNDNESTNNICCLRSCPPHRSKP